MTDEELVAALSQRSGAAILNNVAVCQINNTCPPGWGVIILDCGVNFYYEDGSSDTDQKNGVDIAANGSVLFKSARSDGCVKRMFIAMNVLVPGEGVKLLKDNITDCPAGYCMSSRARGVGPDRNFEHAKATDKLADRLELRE